MTIKQIIHTIRENNSFLLKSHVSPDGDALGSVIAFGLALKRLNKKVTYHIDPSIGAKFSYLPEIENLALNKNLGEYDVSICLDCSDINHLYGSTSFENCNMILNIDHHINNRGYGDINLIESKAGATGEIIYDVIKNLKIELDCDMAAALYTAIVTDTGSFKYSNATSKTHYIISELLKLPIDAWKINKKLFDEHSKSKILLIGKAINNLKILLDGKLAIMVITKEDFKETGASPEDIEGIINYGRDILGVEVAILLKENKTNEFKIGFRSNEYVDVGEIALNLGGGGHIRASGCTMKGYKNDIVDELKEVISKKI